MEENVTKRPRPDADRPAPEPADEAAPSARLAALGRDPVQAPLQPEKSRLEAIVAGETVPSETHA